MKKKIDMGKLFDNNQFVRGFSIVLAFILWTSVAMTSEQTITRTIAGVEVNFDLQAAALNNLGLSVIQDEPEFVSVEVSGSRSEVGQLSAEDIDVTVRVTEVTDSGPYNLQVTAVGTSGGYQIIGYSPSYVEVRLDRLETRSFDVEPVVNGMSVAPGYTLRSEYASPASIQIRGPESELDRVDRVEVTVDLTEPLERTYSEDLPITLLDVQGEVIDYDNSHMTLETDEVQLVIPVLKQTSVEFSVEFTNIPRDFPEDALREYMVMSDNYVELAGPPSQVERLTDLRIGYIDVRTIRIDNNTYSFEVEPPTEQFIFTDNIKAVVVGFDDSKWDSAVFTVDDIRLLNEPLGYEVTQLTRVLYNVEFVGDADVIASMTADDIVAELDLAERDVTVGQYDRPVKISVPGKGLVWAVGEYSLVISVEELEG